jgi:predicted AAA+ superfamily ATPase
LLIFDEIHKYSDWKNWLKGFFDLYKAHFHILVTGSTRLDVYKVGSDSLMGRYFLCKLHPLSVREIIDSNFNTQEINQPKEPKAEQFQNLYDFGGFPQVFLKSNKQFAHKWHALRNQLLFHEDIKDLSNIHEIGQLEVLAELLKTQVGQLLNRTSLAKKIRVSSPTIARWLETLERFYYCFAITPWHKNVSRSLIKEPKLYLWDWSVVTHLTHPK